MQVDYAAELSLRVSVRLLTRQTLMGSLVKLERETLMGTLQARRS